MILPPVVQQLKFSTVSYLVGNFTSSKRGLKGNKLMHTVYKFQMRAYFPWQVIIFKTIYLKIFNV